MTDWTAQNRTREQARTSLAPSCAFHSGTKRCCLCLSRNKQCPLQAKKAPPPAIQHSPTSEVLIQEATPLAQKEREPEYSDCDNQGLLAYQKWWFLREVDVAVEDEMISGTPIFLNDDTLRVVNETHSYFIPMRNIRYIRTDDGYR